MNEPGAPPEIEIDEAIWAPKSRAGMDITIGPISLRIGGGEFFSILGSGAERRSLLLRMIAGLDPATSGEIRIAGKKVESAQRDVGMAFTEPSLLNWRTVVENVLVQGELRNLEPRQCEAQARSLLAAMGVLGCEDLESSDLSMGLAQRVSICRALVHNPSLLLMDDPFHGLDGLEREQMATDIQRLRLTPRVTVVLGTTSINEAVQLSDRVAVMAPDGRIPQTFSIDLPRPRRMDKTTTPQIAEFANSIRTILHACGTLS